MASQPVQSETVQVDIRVSIETEYVYPIQTDPATAERLKSGDIFGAELKELLASHHPSRYWLNENEDVDDYDLMDG